MIMGSHLGLGLIHEQIGIGTGEDLVFFCYLLKRFGSFMRLEDWRTYAENRAKEATNGDSECIQRMESFVKEGILVPSSSSDVSLRLWDFDDHALKVCRQNLMLIATDDHGIEVQISNKDVFKLSSYSEGYTTVSTAAGGPSFILQTLLYCVGGCTHYFIIDVPDSGTCLFELIEELAVLMGCGGRVLSNLMQAAKTSNTETAKEGNAQHEKHIKDAFHGPFMVSCLEGEYSKTQAKLNSRHLMYIDIPAFRSWLYKYLPPPERLQTSSDPTVDQKNHALVSYFSIQTSNEALIPILKHNN
jgi:hypothetical protein